ncbi:MAG: hypothetical protein ACP5SH_04005 [Syntrophobacteraceae bacterium]
MKKQILAGDPILSKNLDPVNPHPVNPVKYSEPVELIMEVLYIEEKPEGSGIGISS